MLLWLFNWLLLLPYFFTNATFSNAHKHPFYVSVVEVNHNQKDATLEISCKLFAEDAQTILEKNYKTTIDFEQPQQAKKIDGLLNDYVQKHLALRTDGKTQALKYIGFERDAESLYGYFEVTGVMAVKTMDLNNSLLYDFTDQQVNIMHVMVGGVRKSYKLDYPKTEADFNF